MHKSVTDVEEKHIEKTIDAIKGALIEVGYKITE